MWGTDMMTRNDYDAQLAAYLAQYDWLVAGNSMNYQQQLGLTAIHMNAARPAPDPVCGTCRRTWPEHDPPIQSDRPCIYCRSDNALDRCVMGRDSKAIVIPLCGDCAGNADPVEMRYFAEKNVTRRREVA